MSRLKADFRLRTIKDVYYYKLPEMKSFKTTGLTSKTKATAFVIELLRKQGNAPISMEAGTQTFKQYAKDFFDYEKCPRVNRLRSEGKELTKRYCDNARKDLVEFVFKTHFSSLVIKDIRKKDVFALREDLLKKTTKGRVNDIITTVGTGFSEAIYREDLLYNPVAGISKLKEDRKEVITYSMNDYLKMFDINSDEKMISIWGTYADFVFEYVECNTEMRNAETRCLKWKNVDFEKKCIYITESFKSLGVDITGLPKNNKRRIVGMCDNLIEVLKKYKEHYAYQGKLQRILYFLFY